MGKFIKAILAATLLALCGCYNQGSHSSQESENESQEVDTSKFVFDNPDAAASLKTWDVVSESDPMSDAQTIQATIKSDKVLETEAKMYEHSTVTIHITKNASGSYKVSINTEGILCEMNRPGTIKIRFDKAKPETFSYRSKDGLNLNISKPDKFVNECMKANDIVLEVRNIQGTKVLLSYHVDTPLDWNIAK